MCRGMSRKIIARVVEGVMGVLIGGGGRLGWFFLSLPALFWLGVLPGTQVWGRGVVEDQCHSGTRCVVSRGRAASGFHRRSHMWWGLGCLVFAGLCGTPWWGGLRLPSLCEMRWVGQQSGWSGGGWTRR